MILHRRILCCLLTLSCATALSAAEQWRVYEAGIAHPTSFAEPPRGLDLDIEWIDPAGISHRFWGFHDGEKSWRFRWLLDQPGAWRWNARFSDGSGSASGNVNCSAGSRPGPLRTYAANPIHFARGQQPKVLRALHVGDRFFARNWDDPVSGTDGNARTVFLDWAQAQGYDCLSIASHLLNRDVSDRGRGWATPDLWDGGRRALRPTEYHLLEAMLGDLDQRGMAVYGFAGFFGQSSDFPTDRADQSFYLRYTIARLGPYPLHLWNVAGPEPLTYPDKFQGAMTAADIRRLGAMIAANDPFDHPLSVHNGVGDDPFIADTWQSYVTLQGWKGTNWLDINQGVRRNLKDKPLLAQEVFWPGNNLHSSDLRDPRMIRRKALVLLLSGAQIVFADMDGNSSSGFSGTLDPSLRHDTWHQAMAQVWDWFGARPFHRMRPRQDLVNAGFCMADPGRDYLLLLMDGGSSQVDLQGATSCNVTWYTVDNLANPLAGGTTTSGLISAPGAGSWIAYLSRSAAVPAPAITSLQLIDAARDLRLGELVDGAQVDLAQIGNQLSVEAVLNPEAMSVRFDLDDGSWFKIENGAPFALAGDVGGDFHPAPLALGWHRLLVTPYSARSGGGIPGVVRLITFKVIDSGGNPQPANLAINFQPAAVSIPGGHLMDSGHAFGDRGIGTAYGWDQNNFQARDRNLIPDQRHDTFNHLQKVGNRRWELELAPGFYRVTVTCSDPGFKDSANHLLVEGVKVRDPDPLSDGFDQATIEVAVEDGRLTIMPDVDAQNAKIAVVVVSEYIPTSSN